MRISENVNKIVLLKNPITKLLKLFSVEDVSKLIETAKDYTGIELEVVYESEFIYDCDKHISKILKSLKEKNNSWIKSEIKALEGLKKTEGTFVPCEVEKAFKDGASIAQIMEITKASRSGVIKYLIKRGYNPTNSKRSKQTKHSGKGYLSAEDIKAMVLRQQGLKPNNKK